MHVKWFLVIFIMCVYQFELGSASNFSITNEFSVDNNLFVISTNLMKTYHSRDIPIELTNNKTIITTYRLQNVVPEYCQLLNDDIIFHLIDVSVEIKHNFIFCDMIIKKNLTESELNKFLSKSCSEPNYKSWEATNSRLLLIKSTSSCSIGYIDCYYDDIISITGSNGTSYSPQAQTQGWESCFLANYTQSDFYKHQIYLYSDTRAISIHSSISHIVIPTCAFLYIILLGFVILLVRYRLRKIGNDRSSTDENRT